MTPEGEELHVFRHGRDMRRGHLSLCVPLGVGTFVTVRHRGALKGEGEGWAEGERTGGFAELPRCGLSIRSGGLGGKGPKRDVQTPKEGESK